jgi:protocatechuate 3,4-dioxygenase alpha subunit
VALLTPFQTVGPFLHLGLRAGRPPMTAPGLTTPVVIHGRLLDGAGVGIGDGVLEFWAAGFDDIGRVWTETDGAYRLSAVKPRTRVDASRDVHAPHFAVRVLARGILTEYLTRVYFDDEPDNARDAVLACVPEARRATLIAAADAPSEYHLDIVVQGERETVFFDL